MADENAQPQKKRPGDLKVIRLKYYHSDEGAPKEQQQIVHRLGLTTVGQTVERPDTREIRSLVEKVPHLIRIIE
jgi:large subunit ribosomal protein L30